MAESHRQTSPFDAPQVIPLPDGTTVEKAFRSLVHLPHCVLLESTMRRPELGRYSFVAADPSEIITAPARDYNAAKLALQHLQQQIQAFRTQAIPDLPPFQGGAMGVLSYELGALFEDLPIPRLDEFAFPLLHFGMYDTVLAFDHWHGKAWCISHGYPETTATNRKERAKERGHWMLELLAVGKKVKAEPAASFSIHPQGAHWEVRPGVYSNFTAETYLKSVQMAVEYILAGDVFQVNLSQRLLVEGRPDPLELYERLRQFSPATFAGFVDLGSCQVLTISPERFLSVRDKIVEARPIKGSRRGMLRPFADMFARADLHDSAKDRAENTMIVDLMRNDLSRVCWADSLEVPQLCGLESYGYIHHLVSVIRGLLKPDISIVDLLAATFPGGSVTGAPKIRAMQIIAELERVARGAYCGSLGYFGFNGNIDLNILIRTMTLAGGWLSFPVGGGIIATSNPDEELRETWIKAQGLLRGVSALA